MRFRVWWLAALLLGACAQAPSPAPPELAQAPVAAPLTTADLLVYRFDFRSEVPRLDVTLTLTGEAEGLTTLLLPSAWAGEQELYRAIEALEISSVDGAVAIVSPEPSRRVVTHPPHARLEVRYSLVQDPAPGDIREYRPIIAAERFHFIGLAALVRPDWPLEREVRATLEFTAVIEPGALAHSFAASSPRHEVQTELGRVLHAIYVGGDFRVERRAIEDAEVAVAITGDWAFADAEFIDLVTRLVAEERRFWRDRADPYFLITLLQTGTRCCGYGGTGLSNGYATFVSTDGPIDLRLKRLIAHEMFHTWNGRKIQREQPEEAIAWFSEGFTDYYARLLALRAGVYSLDDYIAEYNVALEAFYRSPLREAGNHAIVAGLWKSPLIEKLPYHRGDILAHRLNHEIRRLTADAASLDTVMRRILAAALDEQRPVSTAVVLREVEALAGPELAAELAAVVDGRLPTPPPDALGPCVELEWVPRPSIELGFEPASVVEGVLRGVDPSSEAYAKGLRNGQRIDDLIMPRRVDQEARIITGDPDSSDGRRSSSIDVNGPPIDVPRYRMRAGARAQDPACTRWFADLGDADR